MERSHRRNKHDLSRPPQRIGAEWRQYAGMVGENWSDRFRRYDRTDLVAGIVAPTYPTYAPLLASMRSSATLAHLAISASTVTWLMTRPATSSSNTQAT